MKITGPQHRNVYAIKGRIQVNGRNRKDIDEQMRWGRTPAVWAAQRTLTVIVELPAAPLLSVTVSLALKLPVLV